MLPTPKPSPSSLTRRIHCVFSYTNSTRSSPASAYLMALGYFGAFAIANVCDQTIVSSHLGTGTEIRAEGGTHILFANRIGDFCLIGCHLPCQGSIDVRLNNLINRLTEDFRSMLTQKLILTTAKPDLLNSPPVETRGILRCCYAAG